MKNLLFGLAIFAILNSTFAAAKAEQIKAEQIEDIHGKCHAKVERAVYAITTFGKSKGIVSSVHYVETTQNKKIGGEEVETYSVIVDKRGGSGVYTIQLIPLYGC